MSRFARGIVPRNVMSYFSKPFTAAALIGYDTLCLEKKCEVNQGASDILAGRD